MMKVLLACGSHPRHAHLARSLHQAGLLDGLIIEEREEHLPSAPDYLDQDLKRLFDHHFLLRNKAESDFFSKPDFPNVQLRRITSSELNSPVTQEIIKAINPDIFLSYGVHILSETTLSLIKGEAWNIHGGLSPWYRGCITHFWPSYLLEPQMTGMTLHQLTMDLDAGPVIHQTVAPLIRGDGLHALSCRAVDSLVQELPNVINTYSVNKSVVKHQHKTSGRVWRSADWHPSHLRLIYDDYNDQIVDHYLDGKLTISRPNLYKAFTN